MGVDTKTKAIKQHEFENFMLELPKALKLAFKDKYIESSLNVSVNHKPRVGVKYMNYIHASIYFHLDYECSHYDNNKECRTLSLYYDYSKMGSFYSLSTGAWGHSKDISKAIVDYFGGYSDFSNCDSIEMDYCVPQNESKIGIIT